MTHPDPHHAIGENIVQLRREYDATGERHRAAFEARMVHVEPALFDDMLTPGELMAKAYQRLVYVAVFAAGWATASVTFAVMIGG